jgi:isopenicillin-N epimerase
MTNLRSKFLLRPDITFLNFGSFGAVPKEIQERYHQFQNEFEEDPVDFFVNRGLAYLHVSRRALANFVVCDDLDLVFVSNPSYAVNTVAKSFPLTHGDEVLSTNIEYGACDRTWDYFCEKAGAIYRRQPITFPLTSKEDFLEQFWKGLTDRTKLIFISHITSSTALKLPVQEICDHANELGIPVFIDGAHAPGHIDLDLRKMNPTYYTGACHKWMMTPRGCSFLYTKKSAQKDLDPLIISWGYKSLFPSTSQYQDYHQMNGTRDFTPFLMIPSALDFMKTNNWEAVKSDCKKMVLDNAPRLNQILGSQPVASLSDEFTGQMYAAELKSDAPEKFQKMLYDKYKIQIPVIRQDDKNYLRYSIQGMNTQEDLDKLFEALEIEMKTT